MKIHPSSKKAYAAGSRKALLDAGLIKQADLSPSELLWAEALVGGGPIISAIAAPEDRGASRFGHTALGGLLGAGAGAGVGLGAGMGIGKLLTLLGSRGRVKPRLTLRPQPSFKGIGLEAAGEMAPSLGLALGIPIGGMSGSAYGQRLSQENDPAVLKLRRAISDTMG